MVVGAAAWWQPCTVETVLASSCISAMLLGRGHPPSAGWGRRRLTQAHSGWCPSTRRALVIGTVVISGCWAQQRCLTLALGEVPMPEPIVLDQDDTGPAPTPCTVVSAPGRRIVAVGDVHGDLERARLALQLAGVLSADGRSDWTGGSTVLVQVGDVLDRGGDEIAILSLLARLRQQARAAGGVVLQINGNHETMNVAGEFRDAAPAGFQECQRFADYCQDEHGGDWTAAFAAWHLDSQAAREAEDRRTAPGDWAASLWNPLKLQKGQAARAVLFAPGGFLAQELSRHGVVLKVNDWLFAHGGVLPHHVQYGLERINKEVSDWMRAARSSAGLQAQMPFLATRGFDSVVWSRLYSREIYERPEDKITACAVLSAALDALDCRGLVVGHTPQIAGVNSQCGGRVWRIDVGMSRGVLHALPQVLEIVDGQASVLRCSAMAEQGLGFPDVEDDLASLHGLGNLSSLLSFVRVPPRTS